MLHKEQFSDKHIINEYYSSDLSFRCFILKPFCFAASQGDRSSRLGDGCQRDHTLGRVPCLGQPVSLQLPAIAPLGSGALSRAAGVSTAARAMVLPPGTPKGLKRYERLNLFGEGADAKVFAAWDCSEAKLVALKAEPATDDEAARELLAFWMLPQHENVLRLLDCFRDSGLQYLVLKLHSTTLAHTWEAERYRIEFAKCDAYGGGANSARPDPGPAPTPTPAPAPAPARPPFRNRGDRGALRGLAHLHLHGIVHRDFVMPNIMMSHGGDAVQIGDFGLASSAASCLLDRNVTHLHGRSPEVILSAVKGSSTLPAPAYTMDLWSAGVVCFALYFARLPFTAVSDDEHGVVACLQSMCDLLGSPESSWPGVAKLRLWSRYGAHLRSVAAAEPRVAFSSPEFTKREAPNAVDLVASLLRWDPSQRAEAADAASALDARVAGVPAATPAHTEAFAIEGEEKAASKSAVARDAGLCKCSGWCGTKACNLWKQRKYRTGND